MWRIRLAAVGSVALCLAGPAGAADVRPGLWEFRSTRLHLGGLPDMSSQVAQMQQQLKNLPPEMRRMMEQQMAARGVKLGADGTVRSCITPEDAKQDNIYSGRAEGNCTLSDVAKAGNRVSGRLTCTGPDASGNFDARIEGPEHFTTRVDLKSAQGDMQLETDARWVAESCGPAARAPRRAG